MGSIKGQLFRCLTCTTVKVSYIRNLKGSLNQLLTEKENYRRSGENLDINEQLHSSDRETRVPNRTIAHLDISAINIIEQPLNRTRDFSGILNKYQNDM